MNDYKLYYDYINEKYYNERENLVIDLLKVIQQKLSLYKLKKMMILCIGTDKVIYDSYGPLVGRELIKYDFGDTINIVGSTKNTLNALNLERFINEHKKEINNSLVICIDAMASNNYPIGSVIIRDDGIIPGALYNKKIPKIGDISICGIVGNKFSIMDNEVKLDTIMDMRDITIDALLIAIEEIIINENLINRKIKLYNKK